MKVLFTISYFMLLRPPKAPPGSAFGFLRGFLLLIFLSDPLMQLQTPQVLHVLSTTELVVEGVGGGVQGDPCVDRLVLELGVEHFVFEPRSPLFPGNPGACI